MRPKLSLSAAIRVSLTLVLFSSGLMAAAQQETVLFSFKGTNGALPTAALIADAAGNLYGTTTVGGDLSCIVNNLAPGCGTVFELSPPSEPGGAWSQTVLYAFEGGAFGGAEPTASLVFDQVGNIYGTTATSGNGSGTVFELDSSGDETTIWFFSGAADGSTPLDGLVIDSKGNLYGTTSTGGDPSCKCGTVFELSPPQPGGLWTETTLYAFRGVDKNDGANPVAGLVFDARGNLYGTTENGIGFGTVFKLTAPSLPGGSWTERLLYVFGSQQGDGGSPAASLIFDKHGNLYGTCLGGVFQLVPAKGGLWTETLIHQFVGGTGDGAKPLGSVIMDGQGRLYGTTSEGGGTGCSEDLGCGTAFELTPPAQPGGAWSEIFLSFNGGQDGATPEAGLTFGKGDALYGTTIQGGSSKDLGTVFELKH
jgi:uncharacterized repeat protein (TIGR03803 family)